MRKRSDENMDEIDEMLEKSKAKADDMEARKETFSKILSLRLQRTIGVRRQKTKLGWTTSR